MTLKNIASLFGGPPSARRVLGICTPHYRVNRLSYEERALYDEAKSFFDDVMLIDTRAVTYQLFRDQRKPVILHHRRSISDLSALIVRRTRGRQSSTSLLVNTLHYCGCRLSEPPERFSSGSVSKLIPTFRIFKKGYGIDTFVAFDAPNGHALLEHLDAQDTFPLLVKPVDGRQGYGVRVLETLRQAKRHLENFIERRPELDKAAYFQRFMDFRHEYRVFIAYGEPLGIAEKIKPAGQITANATQGADFVAADQPQLVEIAMNCVATDCVYGVDIATDANGDAYVIEINRAPGFQAFEKAVNINVARRLLTHLVTKE
jgi:glutathione synthase/RimK-type ligase-like ATP-grasp enzyme